MESYARPHNSHMYEFTNGRDRDMFAVRAAKRLVYVFLARGTVKTESRKIFLLEHKNFTQIENTYVYICSVKKKKSLIWE